MTSYPAPDACYSRSITEDEEGESEDDVMLKETVFGAEPETKAKNVKDKQSTIQNMVLQVYDGAQQVTYTLELCASLNLVIFGEQTAFFQK